jgi:bidirectional [NiFe] hydrogenase diaphorase subunit
VLTAKQSAPSDDERWSVVDARMLRLGYEPDALIEVLHTVQQQFGFLDDAALRYVAASLRVPLSKVYGVATFYSLFTLKPRGAHTCVVCTGTACHITGAPEILERVRERFGISPQETTSDRTVTLLTSRCLGACGIAPVVVYDGDARGDETAERVVDRLESL